MSSEAARPSERRLRICLEASILALSAALIGSTNVAAFHNYSVAADNLAGFPYAGTAQTRYDDSVGQIPGGGCSAPFSGTPVYQTEWVYISSDGANWEEIGTGHQCYDTYRYWYWGYGLAGVWYPWGAQVIGSSIGLHRTSINRDGSCHYLYFVDVTEVGYDTWCRNGVAVYAGIESYASTATWSGGTTALQFFVLGGSWYGWNGQKASAVDPQMCGHWAGQTAWVYGENVSSC